MADLGPHCCIRAIIIFYFFEENGNRHRYITLKFSIAVQILFLRGDMFFFQNVCYSTEDASSIQLEDRIHDPVNQKILNQIHLEKFSVSTNIFSLILSCSDHDSRAFLLLETSLLDNKSTIILPKRNNISNLVWEAIPILQKILQFLKTVKGGGVVKPMFINCCEGL